MSSSNEHPDMSGNPSDAPFVCDMCGKAFREEDAYGVDYDDSVLFCSSDCVVSFEENAEGGEA